MVTTLIILFNFIFAAWVRFAPRDYLNVLYVIPLTVFMILIDVALIKILNKVLE